MGNNSEIAKICLNCGPLTLAQARFRKSGKKEIICKKCESDRHKKRRLENPEKFKEHGNKYRYLKRPLDTKELTCSNCEETKDIGNFTKKMINIRYPYCMLCSRSASQKSREKHYVSEENARLMRI